MSYNEIPDNQIDVGSPGTEYVKQRLRDNPIAMADGGAGHVYSRDSFDGYAAGEIPLVQQTERINIVPEVPTKHFGFVCQVNGTMRVKFTIGAVGGANVNGQIYVDGVAVGILRQAQLTPIEFTEDIILTTAPAKVELYLWVDASTLGYGEKFGLFADAAWQFVSEYKPID